MKIVKFKDLNNTDKFVSIMTLIVIVLLVANTIINLHGLDVIHKREEAGNSRWQQVEDRIELYEEKIEIYKEKIDLFEKQLSK